MLDKWDKILYYFVARKDTKGAITNMPEKDPIEVCQLNNPGGMNHGKWYVCRGNGRNAEYLRNDGTWHKNVTTGKFFWETEGEAKAAAQTQRSRDGLC